MLNGLDLFSGIGGISLALAPWVRPVAYCEKDRHAQAVLLSRIETSELPWAPIWDDVRTLLGSLSKPVDIIYGGFPCQDISCAGTGKGLGGERSRLVFEVFRLIDELRPTFIFLENVPAIRTRGAEQIVKELAGRGYDCRWTIISAAETGAEFQGRRWFILAKARSEGLQGLYEARRREPMQFIEAPLPGYKRETPPKLDRGFDGIPNGVDRVKSIGNAVAPEQARQAFKRLMGLSAIV